MKANDKTDINSLAGMSRSAYVTQLMTMCAVSLNDHRKSCVFMSFLVKLGVVVEYFLILGRENNSPHVLSFSETTGKDPNKTYHAL